MAGDWIKIEAVTPEKPEILGIAEALSIEPAHVFGCLFMVWRWFDQHTENGNAPSVTKKSLDRIAGVTGFADAMQRVGWLHLCEGGGVTLPNFNRHCGKTAKTRALTAKRVSIHRAKNNGASVTQTATSALPREEKILNYIPADKQPPAGTPPLTPPEKKKAKARKLPPDLADYLPLAEGLKNIVDEMPGTPTIDNRRLQGWALVIRLMVKSDGIKAEDITSALAWYAGHYQLEFMPVIQSGKALREKWAKLVGAKQRYEKDEERQYKLEFDGLTEREKKLKKLGY